MSSHTSPTHSNIFKSRSVLRRIVRWCKKHEYRIAIGIALFLCSIIAFQAGFVVGRDAQEAPLVVETIREDCPICPLSGQETSVTETIRGVSDVQEDSGKNCAFVGSVNSDKYHSPTCHWAKRIKPENIRCFTSAEEAQKAGYKEGCIE